MGSFWEARKKLVLTCPMCREMQFINDITVMKALNDLPFKTAAFNCPCENKRCHKYTTVALRPCSAHRIYLCELCKEGKGKTASCMMFSSVDPFDDDDDETVEVLAHMQDNDQEEEEEDDAPPS